MTAGQPVLRRWRALVVALPPMLTAPQRDGAVRRIHLRVTLRLAFLYRCANDLAGRLRQSHDRVYPAGVYPCVFHQYSEWFPLAQVALYANPAHVGIKNAPRRWVTSGARA